MLKKLRKRKPLDNILTTIFGLVLMSIVLLTVILTRKKVLVSGNETNFEHPKIPVINEDERLVLEADAYIVIDVDTNIILTNKNSHKRIYPASTTKLVTAMTALNVFPLDEIVKVVKYPEGQNMELLNGDELTVRDLVESIIIYSANDAAYNLAKHHSSRLNGFVGEMNNLVEKYGLNNTHFSNFDGIHDSNHFSSAYDLSQIARLSLKNKVIVESAKIKSKEITSLLGNKYTIASTNELLGVVPEIEGLKTGWTPEAGGCFIGLIKIGDKKLISVIMNSPDRFLESKKIVDWIKNNVSWQDYSVGNI